MATVFVSYSHKDEVHRERLEAHLASLKREKVIEIWHDRKISPGDEWADRIDENLKSSDIILLMISADFLASDYCQDLELATAMQRHERGEARVIPVIVRKCDWESAAFARLQAVPQDGKPVTAWADADDAWTDVARGIRRAAKSLARVEPALSKACEPVGRFT